MNPIQQAWIKVNYVSTSKCIQRRTWKPIKGIFMIWPPISCRPHILSCCWFSSEDEVTSLVREFLWITGLDHLVQTRKAKHSAMLQKKCLDLSFRCGTKTLNIPPALLCLNYEAVQKNSNQKERINAILPKVYEQVPPAKCTHITWNVFRKKQKAVIILVGTITCKDLV